MFKYTAVSCNSAPKTAIDNIINNFSLSKL